MPNFPLFCVNVHGTNIIIFPNILFREEGFLTLVSLIKHEFWHAMQEKYVNMAFFNSMLLPITMQIESTWNLFQRDTITPEVTKFIEQVSLFKGITAYGFCELKDVHTVKKLQQAGLLPSGNGNLPFRIASSQLLPEFADIGGNTAVIEHVQCFGDQGCTVIMQPDLECGQPFMYAASSKDFPGNFKTRVFAKSLGQVHKFTSPVSFKLKFFTTELLSCEEAKVVVLDHNYYFLVRLTSICKPEARWFRFNSIYKKFHAAEERLHARQGIDYWASGMYLMEMDGFLKGCLPIGAQKSFEELYQNSLALSQYAYQQSCIVDGKDICVKSEAQDNFLHNATSLMPLPEIRGECKALQETSVCIAQALNDGSSTLLQAGQRNQTALSITAEAQVVPLSAASEKSFFEPFISSVVYATNSAALIAVPEFIVDLGKKAGLSERNAKLVGGMAYYGYLLLVPYASVSWLSTGTSIGLVKLIQFTCERLKFSSRDSLIAQNIALITAEVMQDFSLWNIACCFGRTVCGCLGSYAGFWAEKKVAQACGLLDVTKSSIHARSSLSTSHF
jgi:hypothetical protein